MSVAVLLQGNLERGPETRIDKNGKPYIAASVRVSISKSLQFWWVLAFDETAKYELTRLDPGDCVCVQGRPQFDVYKNESGASRVSLTVIAEKIIALYQPDNSNCQRRE